MKRPYTRREKILFAAPLFFVLIAAAAWQWRKNTPTTLILPAGSYFRALSFSPDGNRLAIMRDGGLSTPAFGFVYDVQTRTKICDLTTPKWRLNPRANTSFPRFYTVSWSPDGKSLVAPYTDGEMSDGKRQNYFPGGEIAPGFDRDQLDKIALWDATGGALTANFSYAPATEYASVGRLRFSSDSQKLISKGSPPLILNAATGQRLQIARVGKENEGGAWNEDLSLVALNIKNSNRYLDYRVQVLDGSSKRLLWKPQTGLVEDFKWCGNTLGVIDSGNQGRKIPETPRRLLLWDGQTRQLLPSPPLSEFSFISSFNFSDDKRSLVFMNSKWVQPTNTTGTKATTKRQLQRELVVWDYQTNRVKWRAIFAGSLTNVQISPDGNWVSGITNAPNNAKSRRVLIFDSSGTLRYERETQSDITAWSPDSTRLAAASAIFKPSGSYGQVELIHVGG